MEMVGKIKEAVGEGGLEQRRDSPTLHLGGIARCKQKAHREGAPLEFKLS